MLANPACTAQQVQSVAPFSPDIVSRALARLHRIGALKRSQPDGYSERSGPTPFHYTAAKGTAPIEQHQRDAHERLRRKQLLRKQDGRRKNPPKGWLMSKAEWERLVVNYERLNPGCGDLIIYEHIAMRKRRGLKPELGLRDYPRLRRIAEKMAIEA